MILSFAIEKETKGAVQYKEVNGDGRQVEIADAIVGTLYVRKSGLKKMGASGIPARLSVVVEEEK